MMLVAFDTARGGLGNPSNHMFITCSSLRNQELEIIKKV